MRCFCTVHMTVLFVLPLMCVSFWMISDDDRFFLLLPIALDLCMTWSHTISSDMYGSFLSSSRQAVLVLLSIRFVSLFYSSFCWCCFRYFRTTNYFIRSQFDLTTILYSFIASRCYIMHLLDLVVFLFSFFRVLVDVLHFRWLQVMSRHKRVQWCMRATA